LLAALFLAACGHGKSSANSCQHNFDCAAGEGCVSGTCVALPCGGCADGMACGIDGTCVAAQGAQCSKLVANGCPAPYSCANGTVCAKPCTLNSDCDPGLTCNSGLKSCTQCTFNADCAGQQGKPVCDTDPSAGTAAATGTGVCVQCDVDIDCTKALGSGHFCSAHACKTGCAADADCNQTAGETCDTSSTPGKCIQCKTNNDCSSFGAAAGACDDTNHCVQCWGATQGVANSFCGPGTPECNLTTKACVQCLTANDASGADCGYLVNGQRDPHDASTCDPGTNSCTCSPLVSGCSPAPYAAGCAGDTQCGCPRNGPGNAEGLCALYPHQQQCSGDPDCGAGNHCDLGTTPGKCKDAAGNLVFTSGERCDKGLTAMPGVTGQTLGACVECVTGQNQECEYRVKGSALYTGSFANLNGARCLADNCVEGCDADADCWPDHTTYNGKTCHLGPGPQNHKCVSCECASPGTDSTWCYATTNPDGSPRCSGTKVCDTGTLSCRLKNQGEQCLHTNECGDPTDPTIGGCIGTGAICVFSSQDGCGTGGQTYCAAGSQYGRCGIPCTDFCANQCISGTSCPSGSSCRQASSETSGVGGNVCVANSCNCSLTSCP
jgi:hypothetical protein